MRRLRRAGLPVVLLVGDRSAGIDVVGTDERRGTCKATRHLLELGHRRIALIDSSGALGNDEKGSGYRQALSEAGVEFDPALVVDPAGHGVADGFEACDWLMQRRPATTAVLAANNSLALGVLRWCQLNGRAVPADLAVCGFDNIEFAAYAATPLSSVNYAVDLVARGAVGRRCELIAAGEPLPEATTTMIDPDLVVRESTLGASV